MFRAKAICFVTLGILLAGLFACNNPKDSDYRSISATQSNPFVAIPGNSESVVKGVKIMYFRDSDGCSNKCQFWNDPKQCGDNSQCKEYAADAQAEYVDCLSPEIEPEIAGERIVWAGSSTGIPQRCDEFAIVTHGSPGWVWSNVGGHYELTCLGYYYQPLQLCCDPTGCVPKP